MITPDIVFETKQLIINFKLTIDYALSPARSGLFLNGFLFPAFFFFESLDDHFAAHFREMIDE